MYELIFLIGYRVISGAQNGFGYGRNERLRIIASTVLVMAGAVASTTWIMSSLPTGLKVVSVALAVIAMVAAIGVEDSFNKNLDIFPADIHLYETITTAAISLAFVAAGGNLIMIAASVYPALIFHKGLVNHFGGLPFWDTRTDDPTGKTFSIPLIGAVVYRGGNAWRIFWAVASIALAVFGYRYGWNVSIYPAMISL